MAFVLSHVFCFWFPFPWQQFFVDLENPENHPWEPPSQPSLPRFYGSSGFEMIFRWLKEFETNAVCELILKKEIRGWIDNLQQKTKHGLFCISTVYTLLFLFSWWTMLAVATSLKLCQYLEICSTMLVFYGCWWKKSGDHQLSLVAEIPILTRFLYILGGCLGFLNHQQLCFWQERKILHLLEWQATISSYSSGFAVFHRESDVISIV